MSAELRNKGMSFSASDRRGWAASTNQQQFCDSAACDRKFAGKSCASAWEKLSRELKEASERKAAGRAQRPSLS
jgi:hypothetical protein